MPNLSTLTDDFNDNATDTTLWPGNYGTTSEVGGRARVSVPATGSASYSGYESQRIYTFDETGWYRVYPQAKNGATSTCYTAITVSSTGQAAGTDVSMYVDMIPATPVIRMMLRVGYWESAHTTVNYSATTHAWWRVRRSGSNLIFETAPDNAGQPGTATARRTVAAPAWVTANPADCRILLEAARDTGTASFSEFDRVTVAAPAPTSRIRVGAATPTAIRVGSTAVLRAYQGSTLVWGTAP
ncbi:hypothetical protein [Geodermatophilus sp. DSM 45219]|uniref:hypothetical protein n=1 Tax=Geodermatophilus sp. DSM 45219 TaxID=1881103 RepID=UPI000892469D|nr:hypothetical protein [Geodermatophilus sp. DSM 45219]SDN78842.1 hypothetical protein SAMN05428965_1628 [Geodermatophilus sp. DSM 45219]